MNGKLLERNAHKLWALSEDLMLETARAGANGKGYAAVAWEVRRLANALFDADTAQVKDIAGEMRLLSFNGMLEFVRVEHLSPGTNKSITVCFNGIVSLMNEIIGASTGSAIEASLLPEAAEPVRAVNTMSYLVPFSIGGVPLIESAERICEVFQIPAASLENKTVALRGVDYPLVKLADVHSGERVTVFLVQEGSKYLAIPIDDSDLFVNAFAPIGRAVPPDTSHKFAEYAREAWNAVGGGQHIFIDWARFV
ncbi:MAG: hypothetical protein LBN97_09160 [Oscillospiraceae bacterium]|nr:hypothetical protein [Oscillospiraceae bacterium]